MTRYDRLIYFDRLCELRDRYLVAGDDDRSSGLHLLDVDRFVEMAWANAEALSLMEYLSERAAPSGQLD